MGSEARYSIGGVRVQFELVCAECGDTDNWINTPLKDFRQDLKQYKEDMKKDGWKIGNCRCKTLCPECNSKRS